MSSRKMNLRTADGETFEVEEKTAMVSATLQRMIEDGMGIDGKIVPLTTINSSTLAKVLEFCRKHAAGDGENETEAWGSEFVKTHEIHELFDILNACNFLDVKELQDLASHRVANLMMDMKVEDVRKLFNITETGYTEKEEAALREKFAWAFE